MAVIVLGRIIDSISKRPVYGVKVKIHDKTATTGRDGEFKIGDLPPGVMLAARITKGNYVRIEDSIAPIEDGKSIPLGDLPITKDSSKNNWNSVLFFSIPLFMMIPVIFFQDLLLVQLAIASSLGVGLLGGNWMYAGISFLLGGFESVTRGEMGIYQDIWGPPFLVAAYFCYKYAQHIGEYSALTTGLLGAGIAILAFAVLVQNNRFHIDLSPAIPTFGVLAAFSINSPWDWYKPEGFVVIFFVIGLVFCLLVEGFLKKPKWSMAGLAIAVSMVLIADYAWSNALFTASVAAAAVVGAFLKTNDVQSKVKTGWQRSTTEYMPMSLPEWAWHGSYFLLYLLSLLADSNVFDAIVQ